MLKMYELNEETLMKLYKVSKKEAKELIQKEIEDHANIINEITAITYLINKKKLELV